MKSNLLKVQYVLLSFKNSKPFLNWQTNIILRQDFCNTLFNRKWEIEIYTQGEDNWFNREDLHLTLVGFVLFYLDTNLKHSSYLTSSHPWATPTNVKITRFYLYIYSYISY